MNTDPERELEAWIDRELRKLPLVEAPPSLVPRVMERLRAREALPWWRQPLWAWPVAARTAFLAVAVLVAAAVLGGSWWAESGLRAYANQAGESLGLFAFWQAWSQGAVTLVQSVWGQLHHPWILAGLGACVGLYLACLGLGVTLFRVALRRS